MRQVPSGCEECPSAEVMRGEIQAQSSKGSRNAKQEEFSSKEIP